MFPYLTQYYREVKCASNVLRGRVVGIDSSVFMYIYCHRRQLQCLAYQDYKDVVTDMEKLATDLLRMGCVPLFVFDGKKCPGKIRAHAQRKKERERLQKHFV